MKREVCAVVGSGEGLGRSLAATFARNGCDVALLSRSAAGSASSRDAAIAANADARVEHFAADAADPDALQAALERVAARFGPVDVLIYNVRGTAPACAPLDMSIADLEAILRLEVIGAFAAARAVLPAMLERGSGSILYSSATAALRGSATYPLYAIAKHGLRALSQSLAKAYAARGVHVAHVRLDCTLDVPIMRRALGAALRPETLANTDEVAESYWWIHRQPRSAWSNEVELRPASEAWTI